jgi:hypothetical protein
MKSPGAALAAMRKTHIRKCANPECGKEFEGFGRALYCSEPCSRRVRNKRFSNKKASIHN